MISPVLAPGLAQSHDSLLCKTALLVYCINFQRIVDVLRKVSDLKIGHAGGNPERCSQSACIMRATVRIFKPGLYQASPDPIISERRSPYSNCSNPSTAIPSSIRSPSRKEPLNNSARSAFQSEKPQFVWCDSERQSP